MLCHVISYHITTYYIISHHVILHYIISDLRTPRARAASSNPPRLLQTSSIICRLQPLYMYACVYNLSLSLYSSLSLYISLSPYIYIYTHIYTHTHRYVISSSCCTQLVFIYS